MKTHIQVVAALHIAFGAISLLIALFLFLALGLAGGIVVTQGPPDAASVAAILGIVGMVLCGLFVLLSLPGIIGGWALYTGRPWGRPVILVLAVLDLLNIPIGTALGIYSLWALLSNPEPEPPVIRTA